MRVGADTPGQFLEQVVLFQPQDDAPDRRAHRAARRPWRRSATDTSRVGPSPVEGGGSVLDDVDERSAHVRRPCGDDYAILREPLLPLPQALAQGETVLERKLSAVGQIREFEALLLLGELLHDRGHRSEQGIVGLALHLALS